MRRKLKLGFSRHEIVGLDLDKLDLFNDLIQFFEIPRVAHRITPYEALPTLANEPIGLCTPRLQHAPSFRFGMGSK